MAFAIRKAQAADVPFVAEIYEKLHTEEEAGRAVIGWVRGIYPTIEDAEAAQAAGELYVLETEGKIAAAGRINRAQVAEYSQIDWKYPAREENVCVLHTLVVDPAFSGHGFGAAMLEFYEALAREMGCTVLRIDTNERNARARRMYAGRGWREAGVVFCCFNGIREVRLVCLEKRLDF